MMRKNAEGGACVDQETAAGQTVCEVEKLAGDDRVQLPPAPPFPCQLQGCSQEETASPYLQCLMQSVAASLASLEASGSGSLAAAFPPRPLPPPRRLSPEMAATKLESGDSCTAATPPPPLEVSWRAHNSSAWVARVLGPYGRPWPTGP